MANSFSFDAAAVRIKRYLWVLAATGALGCGIARGSTWGISFATGALLAIASFHYTHRFVSSIGAPHQEKPSDIKAVFVGLRYIFLAGILYLLIDSTGLAALPALLGLLTPAGAAVLEILYQLASYLPRKSE